MLIKEHNKGRIEDLIRKAEGRSTMRTISYADMVYAIERIEKKLDIPKTRMVGIRASVDMNSQNYPNAYKYIPMSTHFTMVRKASGWDLLEVKREINRRYGHQYNLDLTEDAKKEILRRHSDF